jgi:hypothetical protein
LKVGDSDLFIDLGAEHLLSAERGGERIAIEIKSFIGASAMQDLQQALGQFLLYEDVLSQSVDSNDRVLFLAVREVTFASVFQSEVGKIVLANHRLRLMVFDTNAEVVTRWVP